MILKATRIHDTFHLTAWFLSATTITTKPSCHLSAGDGDYFYNSARDYAGEKGLLDIRLSEYELHTSTAALMLARDVGSLSLHED
ncbi:MAG: hypothetical protein EA392_01240 [Cryomorphaceae bacterium]|nr:MAG: hypothetical protein EA392_01240 [Cryomorphaceae bacterium]